MAQYAANTIHYGFIVTENGDILDEVMVSVMKAPYSYTMEDTVEINCHGGALMMKKFCLQCFMRVHVWRSRGNLRNVLF